MNIVVNNKNKSINKLELYSFIITMYFYGLYYNYLIKNSILYIIILFGIENIILYKIFNYNFITFICHKYWKENLKSIVIPQLSTCLINIFIYNNIKYKYICSFINIFMYNIIIKKYTDEKIESKNIRLILMMLFIIIDIIYF